LLPPAPTTYQCAYRWGASRGPSRDGV
jgi:hypothetical protein